MQSLINQKYLIMKEDRVASLKIYMKLIRCLTRKFTRNYFAIWLGEPLNIGVILARRHGYGVKNENLKFS